MSSRVLFVVEGPHDEAFVGRLLRLRHGLGPEKLRSRVDPFWEKTIPTSFPHNNDLRMRMPVPFFYQNADTTLAIISAIGDSQLAHTVRDTFDVLPEAVDALGVFMDTDKVKSPAQRHATLVRALDDIPALRFPDKPGLVNHGEIRTGVCVFPDNVSEGTLEDLLEKCAELSYPAALAAARGFVASMSENMFEAGELKDFKKPSGRKKATIAALASILRPGKAIQVSISDNRWLTDDTLNISSITAVARFIHDLVLPADKLLV